MNRLAEAPGPLHAHLSAQNTAETQKAIYQLDRAHHRRFVPAAPARDADHRPRLALRPIGAPDQIIHHLQTFAGRADMLPGFESEMQGVTAGTHSNGQRYHVTEMTSRPPTHAA